MNTVLDLEENVIMSIYKQPLIFKALVLLKKSINKLLKQAFLCELFQCAITFGWQNAGNKLKYVY